MVGERRPGTGGLVRENGTEMSNKTEICRSSRDSLAYMGVEGYDLSPLNQSLLQANDESINLRPREERLDCLKCWYTNALNQDKLDELRALCTEKGPDIIFISKTWLVIHIVDL